jgi:hemoglobin-like flavoprotein
MTPRQVQLVQASFANVRLMADAAARLFYHRLFALEPALKPLFKSDLAQQGRKLMAMLGFAVRGLSRLDAIVPGLAELGRRHAGYRVEDRHYDIVGSALLWTLEQGLGEEFTEELKQAWAEAYALIATTMRKAAAELATAS